MLEYHKQIAFMFTHVHEHQVPPTCFPESLYVMSYDIDGSCFFLP